MATKKSPTGFGIAPPPPQPALATKARKNDPAGSGGTELPPPKPQPPGGGGGSPGSVPAGSGPPGPAPAGQEWQWRTDPANPQKGWWVLAAAVVGGLLANQQARQANRGSSTYTDQSTTQAPYQEGMLLPDLEAILNFQRNLVNQGPAYVGGANARPQYAGQPGTAPAPNARATNQGVVHGGGAGVGNINQQGDIDPTKKFGGYTAAELQADPRKVAKLGANARKQWEAQGGGGGGSAGGAGGPGTAPATNFNDPNSVAAAVAREGLAAGADPTTLAAERATRNILAGQGGADSGGTGYQNYNPINDALAQRLLEEPSDADELLRQFLGVGGPGGGTGGGLGGGGGSSRVAGGSSFFGGGYATAGPGGVRAQQAAPSGGGIVPDTVGNSDSYFATQLKQLMDSRANDVDLQALIDAQNADINRGRQSSLWELDAASQGAGRLGGDTWAALRNQANRAAVDQMGTFAARTRLGELEGRRSLYQNLLGQVNTRDLAAMQDLTQREGIAAGERAAGAGAGAGAAAAERGQNLQALGMLLQNQQNNLGELSGLGGRLSQDQLTAIGLAPDLAGVNLSGLGAANQAAGVQSGLRQAQMQAGVARAGLNQQAQMFNAGQQQSQLDHYLRTVLGIGGMGGTSHTAGTNAIPGAGINTTNAALMGALGAGLAAYGQGR